MPALTRAALKRLAQAEQATALHHNATTSPHILGPSPAQVLDTASPSTDAELVVENENELGLSSDTTLLCTDLEGGVNTESDEGLAHYSVQHRVKSQREGLEIPSLVAITSPSATGLGTYTRWVDSQVTTVNSWVNGQPSTVVVQVTPSNTFVGTHTKWYYPTSPGTTGFVGPIRNIPTQRTRPNGYSYVFALPEPNPRQTKYQAQQVMPNTGTAAPRGFEREGTVIVDDRGNAIPSLNPLQRGDTLILNNPEGLGV